MMKNFIKQFFLIIFGVILAAGLNFAYAWSEPVQTPPDGNIAAPINESATSQYKSGALGIEGALQAYNSVYLATSGGNVGIGTTNPQAKLDVNGAIKFSTSDSVVEKAAPSLGVATNTSNDTLLGSYSFCGISNYWANSNRNSTTSCRVYYDGTNWRISMGQWGEGYTNCSAVCIK